MNKRIWFSTTSEHREIEKLERNQHKDILIQLDGGEIWQFTPHQKGIKTPPVSRISNLGHGTDMKTGKVSSLAWLSLENPTEHIEGNLRKLPVTEHSPKKTPKNPKGAGAKPKGDTKKQDKIFAAWNKARKSDGKLTMKEFWQERHSNTMGYEKFNKIIGAARKRRNRGIGGG